MACDAVSCTGIRVAEATADGQPGSTPLSQLTIKAWIKPAVAGGGLHESTWDDYGNPGVFLGLWNDSVQFSVSTSQDPGVGVSNYSGKVAAGVWQHIAAVSDGTQVKAYGDGSTTRAIPGPARPPDSRLPRQALLESASCAL